jgi:hypothetical protein
MSETTTRERHEFQQINEMTANNIRRLMTETHQEQQHNTSLLSVQEREELIKMVAQVLPAGNVTSFILGGILNLKGRDVSPAEGRTHVGSLLKGLSIVRNNAFYSMMFVGPATVLAGYNMLLKLAGVNTEDFLPDGVWQFYTEFGLREDTARHQSETLGFHHATAALGLGEVEKLSAWLMTCMWLLRVYDDLLANEWEERTRIKALQETTGLTGLHRIWQKIIPYSLPHGEQNLVLYRRARFERFCAEQLNAVGHEQRSNFESFWKERLAVEQRASALQTYQSQMDIRAALEAGEYSEKRVPIAKADLHIGIVYKHRYYLVQYVDPVAPNASARVQQQAQAVLHGTGSAAEVDTILSKVPRTGQEEVRRRLHPEQLHALNRLRTAPVLINWDTVSQAQPLSSIRERQRGVGDHALTLFRTDASMVFDFSHIFFDGPWAMAVAEMMTGEAIRFAQIRVATPLPHAKPASALNLIATPDFARHARKRSVSTAAVSAEVSLNLAELTETRKLLMSRTNGVTLTINDLLILYRSIFNQVYQPSAQVKRAVEGLLRGKDTRAFAQAMLDDWQVRQEINPSIMIPIDASQSNPRDRIFPSIFRSPFADLLPQHIAAVETLQTVNTQYFNKKHAQETFKAARAEYLSTLKAFGEVMRRYREIAMQGQSTSATAIRLIAGLPGAMQRIADGIPGRLTFMNEALKGEEVFSNVGQVAPGSSLARFVSAKDDNDKKVLVWGVLTDNHSVMHITLRDFRPAVTALSLNGFHDLAQQITLDFAAAYVRGLAKYVEELKTIVAAPKF